MSFSTKDEIRKMVGAALKPHFHAKEITKQQYTDICRDVSRMMYDKVGDAKSIADQEERNKWVDVAAEEVEKALGNIMEHQTSLRITTNGVDKNERLDIDGAHQDEKLDITSTPVEAVEVS